MMPRMKQTFLIAALFLVPCVLSAQQESLTARAAVQSQQVYVGQQFLLQIQIEGTDQPDAVDFRALEKDFAVTEVGGGASNSTSMSIINGRMTQSVRHGYKLNYRLSARRAGDFRIPALTVSNGGRTVQTQPLAIRVQPPQENNDFKLRMSLSEQQAYVGQPIKLSTIWYIGRDIREFSFTMPLLEDNRFEILEPDSVGSLAAGQNPDQFMEILLGDRRARARKGAGEFEGRQYTQLSFEKVLIPRKPGEFVLPGTTVAFQTPDQGARRRSRPFDDFFGGGFFSSVFDRQVVMQTLAIPSNRPRLKVLELPSEDRPAGFHGWIGEFTIQAEAEPLEISVGEPITLELRVKGNNMLSNAQLPSLEEQTALSRDFKIPREMAAGENREDARYFVQTLRVKYDGVTQIPPIELHYFDPRKESYLVARTEPIPLAVKAARIVTAEDAEGLDGVQPRQLEVESSESGIAHNYIDESALEPVESSWTIWVRPIGPVPLVLIGLVVPPLICLSILGTGLVRRFEGSSRWRSKSTYTKWQRVVAGIDLASNSDEQMAATVLAALREYFAARLSTDTGTANAVGTRQGALTYEDVVRLLHKKRGGKNSVHSQMDDRVLTGLSSVFERCELGRYAGGAVHSLTASASALDSQDGMRSGSEWKQRLLADARTAVDGVEGILRGL